MKVLNVIEHEDGSATLELDIEEDEKALPIEFAVVSLLKKFIDEKENEE